MSQTYHSRLCWPILELTRIAAYRDDPPAEQVTAPDHPVMDGQLIGYVRRPECADG